MRSILVKISLWFFATLIGTLIAFYVIAILTAPSPGRRNDMFARTLSAQLEEARWCYETGGAKSLQAYLDRLHKNFTNPHYLLDGSGRDLITGQDLSALMKREPDPMRLPFLSGTHPEHRIVWASSDKRYHFISLIPSAPDTTAVLPYGLCVLALMGILCYVMAVYLASPLRQLRHTLDRFGHGDLSIRSHISRKDEFGELGRAFNQMADRIQTLLTAERRLLQDISHELRSPLARLEFAVELARTSENRSGSLDRIKRDLDRLGALTGELFQVTRAEGDPAARKQDAISLDSLMHLLVEDCTLEAEVRHCHVRMTAAEPVSILGDAELLRRAVENVLRNAIRHSPEGTSIEVDLRRQNGSAFVSVRDYGSGVPEDTIEDIFKPFFRVDSDRNRASGGVGLGLAIAQRAVHLHHGQLHARNMHPGLLMTMELPVSGN